MYKRQLLHFVNSCPPDADCAVTADRKVTDVSRLTSSLSSFFGTQIKVIAREAAFQDPSLNGNLVDVCFQILVDNDAKNVSWIAAATIS